MSDKVAFVFNDGHTGFVFPEEAVTLEEKGLGKVGKEKPASKSKAPKSKPKKGGK